MEAYSPKAFLRTVKKVKSLLREHHPQDVLDWCINYIHEPTDDDLDHLKRHPWLILLIVKWAFLSQSQIQYSLKRLDLRSFDRMIQLTHSLGSLVKMPSNHTHLNLFFRNISYQQFIYQKKFSITCFARQSVLFNNLPDNHTFRRAFKDETGLDIEAFLQLSLLLCSRFLDRKHQSVSIDWFSNIANSIGWQNINQFLRSLSVDRSRLRRKLIQANRSKGGWQEFYEQTPFLEFPLIKEGDEYTCLHPMILFRTLENFLYDCLKRPDPSAFMDIFGNIFEDYLKLGLHNSQLDFAPETELLEQLPEGVGCVDYIIFEDRANIFIDAKAVEMPYLGMVSDTPQIIQQKVKNSATKAIQQAYSINTWLQSNEEHETLKFKDESYLLVVTFKELYLSNGSTFYDAIAKKNIDKITNKTPAEAIIDLANIYFITIDEFDFLMELERTQKGSLVQLLRKSVEDDKSAETRKFEFSQHLHSFNAELTTPSYLESERENMFIAAEKLLAPSDRN